jgi:hypothetical protein
VGGSALLNWWNSQINKLLSGQVSSKYLNKENMKGKKEKREKKEKERQGGTKKIWDQFTS